MSRYSDIKRLIMQAIESSTPAVHTHAISETTGLQTALDAKSATTHNHDAVYEANNPNIQAHVTAAHAPTNAQANAEITKAEIEAKLTGEIASHTHPGGGVAWGGITGTLANQSDLDTALLGKASTGHNHNASYSALGHAHSIGDTTGLQTALDGKAASSHAHAIGDTTGLQTALDGKSATTHNHDASYAALGHNHDATYSALGHNHDAAYEALGAVATHAGAADPHTGYQKESEKGQANGYAGLGAGGLVPIAQLASGTPNGSKFIRDDSTLQTPGGGSDPWTYLRLTSDFTTTSATAVNVTGLAFTPTANQRYEFVARLMVRTATATVGPRPGLAWPTGMTDGVAFVQQTSSATANVFANGNINAAVLSPVGGLPNNTQSYPALIEGMAIAGASPSGDIRVQLASETAGTTVTAKAQSFLKYRTVP